MDPWIQEWLSKFKITKNIAQFLQDSLSKWKTVLSGESELDEVNKRRGIVQGDIFSPLLFIVAFIPITLTLRDVKSSYEFSREQKLKHVQFMDHLK